MVSTKKFFKNLFFPKTPLPLKGEKSEGEKKVHFLLPETAEEYENFIQKEREEILAKQNKGKEMTLYFLEGSKKEFKENSEKEKLLRKRIQKEEDPIEKEILERWLARVISSKVSASSYIKELEEEVKNQPSAEVDKKKLEEKEKSLRREELQKIVSNGAIAGKSYSFPGVQEERCLILYREKFFLAVIEYRRIRENRVDTCKECGSEKLLSHQYGMGGACYSDFCPKCSPQTLADKSWNRTIKGKATYFVTVGYEKTGRVVWGTDSIQQFRDDELRVVSEYNKTGKIEEGKIFSSGHHDKPW